MVQVISEELGRDLKEVTLDMLGTAESVKITKENTTIVNGKGDSNAIKERINQIKAQMKKLLQNLIKKNYKKD